MYPGYSREKYTQVLYTHQGTQDGIPTYLHTVGGSGSSTPLRVREYHTVEGRRDTNRHCWSEGYH